MQGFSEIFFNEFYGGKIWISQENCYIITIYYRAHLEPHSFYSSKARNSMRCMRLPGIQRCKRARSVVQRATNSLIFSNLVPRSTKPRRRDVQVYIVLIYKKS